RVIGIELSPELSQLAQHNAETIRGRKTEVHVVNGDAARYEVPDDVTMVVLFNPFQGHTMQAALRRITDSVDRVPRPLCIAYGNPHEHDLIIATGRFVSRSHLHVSWRPTRTGRHYFLWRFYDAALESRPKLDAQW